MLTVAEAKACKICGTPLHRHPWETPSKYQIREVCHRADCLPPLPPVSFPGARAETWSEVPDACDRCGGPWKIIPGGIACRVCPRQVYVRQAIQDVMRRDHRML